MAVKVGDETLEMDGRVIDMRGCATEGNDRAVDMKCGV